MRLGKINVEQLEGMEINFEERGVQLFEVEERTIGVQVLDDPIMTSQMIVLLRNNEGELVKGKNRASEGKKLRKIVRVFETKVVPGKIKKKAILKLKPVR